ncbi:MAG: tetratricopeptide repeat protein [Alphaproteobacteria bacterium]
MKFLSLLVVCLCAALPAMAGGEYEMNQGSIALRQGDFSAAVAHLSAAIESGELAGEATAAMRISRGQALYHLEQYQPAADDLTAAIDSGAINDTLVGIALASRASAYRMMGDWARAVADFDAAIALGTVNEKMFFHRGLALEAAGQRARALEDFRRAHDMAPDNDAIRAKLLELGAAVD